MRAAVFALVLLAGPAGATSLNPLAYAGTLERVRDGDTIIVDGLPIRLKGIAAPESNEPMGRESTLALRALVGRKLVCMLSGEVSYDRMVGWCSLVGLDLGDMQLAAGLARRCPFFDPGHRYPDTPASTLPLPTYCVAGQP
jgi:endonuclease YncB( thermonuclease family)